ncbi:MAG TPA: hypothetical protein VKU03_06210 [Roseiarcus sp.]|nr:hypothetical protein [Roseiarcus sp.]
MTFNAAAPRRRPFLSLLGAALAALYLAAIIAGYVIYVQNAGQWLADLTLLLIAMPFTWTMSVLTSGAFSMSGDETGKVVAAALFCCALAYLAGAITEGLLRATWRLARRG